jgi:hypothetical protein
MRVVPAVTLNPPVRNAMKRMSGCRQSQPTPSPISRRRERRAAPRVPPKRVRISGNEQDETAYDTASTRKGNRWAMP